LFEGHDFLANGLREPDLAVFLIDKPRFIENPPKELGTEVVSPVCNIGEGSLGTEGYTTCDETCNETMLGKDGGVCKGDVKEGYNVSLPR